MRVRTLRTAIIRGSWTGCWGRGGQLSTEFTREEEEEPQDIGKKKVLIGSHCARV